MNQTSLVGRPLHHLTQSLVNFAEKRGIWTYAQSSDPSLARSGFWNTTPASSTGMNVNAETALTYSVFWACIRNISEDVASLPLVVYKQDERGGKTPLRDSRLYELLHDEPNPRTDSMTFRQTLTAHVMTWGNGYAEIQRDAGGRIVALWQITPDRVSIQQDSNGDLWYQVTNPNGGAVRLNREDMFHIAGYGYDGTCGYSIVEKARESLGLGMATERFGGTFFGNGATFGGVFEHPGRLSEPAMKNFRDSVNSQHRGVDKAHKFMVVEEGMKYQAFGVPPNVAQFLETRQFQVEEICRWFRMPPHMVQHLLRTSYNSIEHQRIEYSVDTIRPWCVRWENAIRRQLVPRLERFVQKVEHNMDGIQRGDQASRYQAWATARQWGFMSVNEIRAKENMNPLPGDTGDSYLVPQNMVPADRHDEVIDKQVAPDPKPVVQAPAANDGEDDKKADERMQQIITELRTELATVHATLTEKMAQLHTSTAAHLRFDQFNDLFEPYMATLRQEIAEAQQKENTLSAMLLAATERAERIEAEKEAQRIKAEEAAAEARARLDAAKQAATDEVYEVRAELDKAAMEAARRIAEVQAEKALVLQSREHALDTVKAHAAEVLEQEKAERAAELDAVHAQLLEAEKRELQAKAEREAKEAALAEAQAAILKLSTDLAESVKAQSETTQRYLEESTARGLAQTQATEVAAALIEAQQERDRIAADRDQLRADIEVAIQRAVEAQRLAESAKSEREQLAQAELAARHSLAQESAKCVDERAAHEVTRAILQARAQDEVERIQAECEAQREMILRVVGRFVSKESEKVRRNSGSGAKLLAWADGHYLLAEETWVDDLRPIMRGHLARIRSTEDVDTYTRAMIHPHLETAAAQIRAVAKGDPEDFAVSLERLLARWEQERPASIAALVAKEEVSYVRSL